MSYKVAPYVCDAVITDEEWLWQMLLNLLTNACKYTDRGTIKVVVSLSQAKFPAASLSVPLDHAVLLFEVIDTGKASLYFLLHLR